MKWAELVARIKRVEVYTGFWLGNMSEYDNSEDSSVEGRIILRWIFSTWDEGAWM
jgi:hypothetical protein